ncbi:MAG: helix-turn-helix domain-containing protein [Candidatus Bathyarchaeia archaeon]|jgi:sugar-specific transcriptional regulator TrmB
MSRTPVSVKAERALRDVGLTEYETMAYLSLVKAGELTANDVSSSTTIPYSKVYTVLDTLEKKGWVEVKGGRPRMYYPKSPVEALRSEKTRQEDRFEKNREMVVSELQAVYEHREIKEKPEIWIIRGEDNIISRISETIIGAKKELMVALPVLPLPLIMKVIPTFQTQMDRKLQIQLLITREAEKALPDILVHLTEVRTRDDMFGGGIVADGHETLLFLNQGIEREESLAIWSDHVGLNMISRGYFKHLWETSSPMRRD